MDSTTILNMENRFNHNAHQQTAREFVVNGDWPQTETLGADQRRVDQPCTSEFTGSSDPELEGEVPSSNLDEESRVLQVEYSEQDETVALWVKWRGKWQAGIRCARADCPLTTLKARPTHDRKKYFVVFFPHSRNYSWADMLLVRPIHEFPEPIAHTTHYKGLEKVKDLSLPRRFIMQRLAVGMVNIIDRLHNKAVIESARQVTSWKDFALEASRCNGYLDLGGMLLKLQNMILQQYTSAEWLKNSLESWAQRCRSARSAESVEMLKEELEDSVLWNDIESLWDAPVQPELGSEWKTWKQEVMKWFSISHPLASVRDVEQQCTDDSTSVGLQINSKRAKLEVRRAEMHASQVESSFSHEVQSQTNTADVDSGFLNGGGTRTEDRLVNITSGEGVETSECPGSVVDRWDEIVVESGNNEFSRTIEGQERPADGGNIGKSIESGNRYQRCLAFIETKGRQCIRWANDGDVYCCVHLGGTPAKGVLTSPADAPMCEGTTVHGTKCKHRSQHGSTFCKKHRPLNLQYSIGLDTPSGLQGNTLKRSHSEISPTMVASGSGKEIISFSAMEVQNPVQINSVCAMQGEFSGGTISLVQKTEDYTRSNNDTEFLCCIGSYPQNNDSCPDHVKFHTLYCEKHLPNFLKRARNGKSRIISKEIFLDFLRHCSSREQKLHLHRACVLLHGYVKSVQSHRNPVTKETQLQGMLSEASNDSCVGECLMKLISCEKEKLNTLWGFDVDIAKKVSSGALLRQPLSDMGSHNILKTVTCKICSKEFPDGKILGAHWMDVHKQEAESLFRGYACAICLNSFTDKKVLETHVVEGHGVLFVDQCLLFHCIPCGNQFMDPEQLCMHVLSEHSKDFELWNVGKQHKEPANVASQMLEPSNKNASDNSGIKSVPRGLICKLCGTKFNQLADLGRHHQAAHRGMNSVGHISSKRGTHLNSYKSNSGRLGRPSFRNGLQSSSYRIRKRANMRMKKRFQASSSSNSGRVMVKYEVSGADGLGRLAESQCSSVAKILFAEIQKAKPRPSNLDILSIARSTCCKVNLQAALVEQFGVLPERLYLKAAKLCSDLNIQVEWHQEGFICPNGCQAVAETCNISSLALLPSHFVEHTPSKSVDIVDTNEAWGIDECHYIIESHHIKPMPIGKAIVLSEDLSFGKESVPVNCVVDDERVNSLHTTVDGSNARRTVFPMPWENFTYVTERLIDPCLGRHTRSLQLGCACPHSTCSPEACDHVYLFENDNENAKDINGEPMNGKFPYDGEGRMILEEGYLVYECNSKCTCDRTCPNRVLQNGLQVKLEVFKTEKKGWAVRAAEAILRGTFVCEYIGEILNDLEATKRVERYINEGCCYLYKVQAEVDDMSEFTEGVAQHMIDATRYGNVARFINHSCSPNLVTYQVLVESMDSQHAHVGLYASRDIAVGEELAYDYRQKILLFGEHPCHCGAPNCLGHIS